MSYHTFDLPSGWAIGWTSGVLVGLIEGLWGFGNANDLLGTLLLLLLLSLSDLVGVLRELAPGALDDSAPRPSRGASWCTRGGPLDTRLRLEAVATRRLERVRASS